MSARALASLAAGLALALAAPASARHGDHVMPDVVMPDVAMPQEGPASDAPERQAGHDMQASPAQAPVPRTGTDLPAGDAPPPAVQPGHLADRYWDPASMARSRERDLRREHGGMTVRQVLFNLAEYRAGRGGDGYHWDGEAWIGGDIHRLTLKTQGEGDRGRGERGGALGEGEVQVLYSRAIDPYWNLQAGVRHDVRPDARTYATIGVEGLAPYWFDVEAALFLSDKGDVLARAEAWVDQRVTQFIVLQPRIEANLAAQDVPASGIGSGLGDLELGLRLRYEKSRRLAPYVGVSWERRLGDTARLARARGDGAGGLGVVVGIRAWM